MFAQGITSFYRKNQGLADEIGKYVGESAKSIGARQFAQIAAFMGKPLEIIVDDHHFLSWESARANIQDYLRSAVPGNSSVELEFYDGRNGKPYEKITLGKNFGISRAFMPSNKNGRIRAVISEGNVAYSMEFSCKQPPIRDGWHLASIA